MRIDVFASAWFPLLNVRICSGSHIFIRKEIARILLPHSVTAHHEPRQNIVGSEHMQLQQLEQIGSASATASNADASSSVHPGTGITIEEIATDLAPTPTTKEEEEDEEKRLLKHITSVEEVQVYYRDDGRVSLKVCSASFLYYLFRVLIGSINAGGCGNES